MYPSHNHDYISSTDRSPEYGTPPDRLDTWEGDSSYDAVTATGSDPREDIPDGLPDDELPTPTTPHGLPPHTTAEQVATTRNPASWVGPIALSESGSSSEPVHDTSDHTPVKEAIVDDVPSTADTTRPSSQYNEVATSENNNDPNSLPSGGADLVVPKTESIDPVTHKTNLESSNERLEVSLTDHPPNKETDQPPRSTWAERHPDMPNVEVHVHLGYHGSAADFAELPGILQGTSADILLIEDANGTNEFAEEARQAAKGQLPRRANAAQVEKFMAGVVDSTTDAPVAGQKRAIMTAALLFPRLQIKVCDIPAHQSLEMAELRGATFSALANLSVKDSLDATLEDMMHSKSAGVALQKRREDVVFGSSEPGAPETAGILEERITDAIIDSSSLQKKSLREGISVVLTFGAYHKTIPQRLAAAGIPHEVSYDHADDAKGQTYADQLAERLAARQPICHELVEKTFTAHLVLNAILHNTNLADINNGSRYIMQYADKIASLLESRDTANMHAILLQEIKNQQTPENINAVLRNYIEERLVEAGHSPLASDLHEVPMFLNRWGVASPNFDHKNGKTYALPNVDHLLTRYGFSIADWYRLRR